ncbi:unnamed protein product [Meloidogyne enterolobii]|uniref:Uncharacterized protein n=1 Tax=Meloidogyne enterolobii TaxID=390850 RepID=A0ACB0YVL8_MELEN
MDIAYRIVTVLFYLSTPEKGGYTVLNNVKTTAKSTKHDALFWYNLWRNGDRGKGRFRVADSESPIQSRRFRVADSE